MVPYGQDDCVVVRCVGLLRQTAQAVFLFGFIQIDPGVIDIYLDVVGLQVFDDVYDLGVAQVRAVFFEGEAEYEVREPEWELKMFSEMD